MVADFISGAVEALSPARHDDGWDLIEGHGSLYHPSFAGVSTGLLHGAQPAALLLCHDPSRVGLRGLPHYDLPDLAACLEANLNAARLTSPHVLAVGVALNTSKLLLARHRSRARARGGRRVRRSRRAAVVDRGSAGRCRRQRWGAGTARAGILGRDVIAHRVTRFLWQKRG